MMSHRGRGLAELLCATAESALYRQRLEVIAEKRRLQEEIQAARGELEDEKLRVQRLKRKSLRERWLMDGAAEESERPEDPTSQDPQSPEGHANARIRTLEDSLFTLQSQLQLLQSASTGAQHRPSGRPTWRRQGPRPLSQPIMEAALADPAHLDKRTSLPPGSVDLSPESLSESVGVPPALRLSPGGSPEANGPSPLPEPAPHPGADVEAKVGGVVKVVWAGLRPTEDHKTSPSGPELEAKVEEVVLEAIGDRQGVGSLQLPSWVREEPAVVEVVWEGLGGGDAQACEEEAAPRAAGPSLQEGLEASRLDQGSPGLSPEGDGRQGGPGTAEEGSFIWVERVTLSEDWEELLMEGLEGTTVGTAGEGAPEAGLGAQQRGGDQGSGETEKRETEASERVGEAGREAEPGSGKDEDQAPLEAKAEDEKRESQGSPRSPQGSREGGTEKEGEELLPAAEAEECEERKEGEGEEEVMKETLVAEKNQEGSVEAERKGGEGLLDGKEKGELDGEAKESEKLLDGEMEGGEGVLDGKEKGEGALDGEAQEKVLDGGKEGGEVSLDVKKNGEGVLDGDGKESEKPLDGEIEGGEGLLDGKEKGEGALDGDTCEKLLDGGKEGDEGPPEVEKTAQATGEGAQKESAAEEQGSKDPEKPEGSQEAEAGTPQAVAEDRGLSQDARAPPWPTETLAPEQAAETQPLLQQEAASAHPAPTYAPSRQPEPSAPAQSEEASGGPKQKTCQCCAVM